jgi:putative glutamine amidotransferase
LFLKHSDRTQFGQCDAFVIGGGININPKVYNEKPETVKDTRPWWIRFFEKIRYPVVGLGIANGASVSQSYEDERDNYELEILKHADSTGKKALGICRGHQLINASTGGKLSQSLISILKGGMQEQSPLPRKLIHVKKGTMLNKITEKDSFYVNSLHAQYVSKLGEGLTASSYDTNGIIQSCENETKRIIGCQWHPEYMIHKPVRKLLFKWLVS